MIQEYFRLQLRRFNRYLNEFGVHPVAGYALVGIAFWGFSEYFFYKLPSASYFYPVFLFSIFSWIHNLNRDDFFKTIFTTESYKTIRIIEHIIISLPFGIFLLYKGHLLLALGSIMMAIAVAMLPALQFKSKTVPTPFTFYPFEFAVGIRNSYWLYLVFFFILIMAIRVDNFNLGIATLIATLVLSMTFYSNLEGESYIWNYSGGSLSFIKNKLLLAIAHASMLSFPFLCILLIVWPSQYLYIIGLQVLGFFYLITIVLAKYAAYPRVMSLPQGLILLFCLWIPPLILVVIPYFFMQSNRKLKCLLT